MTSTSPDIGVVRPAPLDAVALPRLLRPGVSAIADHLAVYGPLPEITGPEVIAAVEQAGLTGRGGAAFPTARKLATVARGAGRKGTIVVANGCEGEPASTKDRTLMSTAPHLVLDGIELAARAVGARQAYLCVHEDEHELRSALTDALSDHSAAVPIALKPVPHRYVASEESALVRALNGGPSMPAYTPPRPFERGVANRPTLVDNVETLAHLALIARYGPRWFRALGSRSAPGTNLVTLTGAVRNPGVYEIPLGITGSELIALAGGTSQQAQAVLCGGYFGSWLAAETFDRTEISAPGLAAAGAAIGAGVFLVLSQHACALEETARIADYLADQSAGQCGPCLNGLPALAGALHRLATDGGTVAAHTIQSLIPYVERRGACRHPNGATRMIASALNTFPDEVRAHTNRRPCPATRHPGRKYGS